MDNDSADVTSFGRLVHVRWVCWQQGKLGWWQWSFTSLVHFNDLSCSSL